MLPSKSNKRVPHNGDIELDRFRKDWTKQISQGGRSGAAHKLQKMLHPATRAPKVLADKTALPALSRTLKGLPLSRRSAQAALVPDHLALPDRDRLRKFVVGLDYGTTYISVSFSSHPIDEETPRAHAWEVKSVGNWPDANNKDLLQVPTQSWYSTLPIDRTPKNDFGHHVSALNDAQAAEFLVRQSLDC